MVSGEDDDGTDGDDDDALSRYDAATGLGDLPGIRSLLEPVGGSSSSVVVVEETKEEVEKEAGRLIPDPKGGVDRATPTGPGPAGSGRGWSGGAGVVIGGGAGGREDPGPAGL
jgi:hypothetical protein